MGQNWKPIVKHSSFTGSQKEQTKSTSFLKYIL